ncbi:Minf_1886 family protein [Candidatus Latescibacterota bacterium]
MLSNIEIINRLDKIAEEDKRYRKEAYLFVLVALEHTVSKLPVRRHLSGQDLSKGIANFARQQYGYMAKTVLDRWGVRSTMDYGEIVYLMIEHGLLSKSGQDSKKDFAHVYNFDKEFSWNNVKPSKFPERF